VCGSLLIERDHIIFWVSLALGGAVLKKIDGLGRGRGIFETDVDSNETIVSFCFT